LDAEGIVLLNAIRKSKVKVSAIAVNAFNFPKFAAPNGNTAMGTYVVATAAGLVDQISKVKLNGTRAGINLIVGANDVSGEILTLDDTKQVAAWANRTASIDFISIVNPASDDNAPFAKVLAAWTSHEPFKKTTGQGRAVIRTSTNGQCGVANGRCPTGQCCSQFGWCGTSSSHCGTGCQGTYSSSSSCPAPGAPIPNSPNGLCGPSRGRCPTGQCCSQFGFCGTSSAHCDASCQSTYSSSPSCPVNGGTTPAPAPVNPGTGTGSITFAMFSNALRATGCGTPSTSTYNTFIEQSRRNGLTVREAAMALAQMRQETGCLQWIRELACLNDGCPTHYRSAGDPWGVYYFGRGYIQLSWSYNYKAFSQFQFGNTDTLFWSPDRVAAEQALAWGSAFWFLKQNAFSLPAVRAGRFGAVTMVVNGALECYGWNQAAARNRWNFYRAILPAFGSKETPIESGCYN